ncbi:carbohydrate esterase family 1 protein [Myriangium duriaei CBS 260.36]|uniref:feruloyl esterase n=1 Tax=Myriangium duriaei CBS 260.36 TaxID=1168546 RepID=A0A9P4J9Q4_9PEZI|nr:carbohydrate esterase family 1 protein [Myriangium duriaei CBS 260.36]
MWSRPLLSLSLFAVLQPLVYAQNLSGVCPAYDGLVYTDANNQSYAIYCNSDSSPGSYTNQNTASFAACMAVCDTAGSACQSVTYTTGGACYLKAGFSSNTTASGVYSAQKFTAPPYPAPQLNYANASTGCGTPLPAGITPGGTSTSVNVTYGGLTRSYRIHIPSLYDIHKASPLILSFHGRGSSPGLNEQESGLDKINWNPYGIVVYPQGINGAQWQGDPMAVGIGEDDTGFTDYLITAIQSQYCIDTGRTFATGMSNGGGFSGILACNSSLSSRFAAFGMHSGAFYTNTTDIQCTSPSTVLTSNNLVGTCAPGHTIPLLEVHGTADGTIPYLGGARRGYCLPTIAHWVSDWAARDGLSTTANMTYLYNNPNVTRFEYGGAGGMVTHVQVGGMDHVWAQTANGAPIDSTPLMINHFYRWTNPNGPTFDYLNVPAASNVTASSTATTSASSTSTSASSTSTSSSSASSGSTSASSPASTSASTTSTAPAS